MQKKIKILHFIPGFNFGGIESRMLDVLKKIDKSKYQLDFLILTEINNTLIEEIKCNGGNVYRIPPFSPKTIASHYKEMKDVVNKGNYDIIHCHSSSTGFLLLRYAKIKGVKGRILHSRTSSFKGSSMIPLRILMQKLSIHYSNKYLAVSRVAGNWFFGYKDFTVIPNSIELDKYLYDIKSREKIRNEYNISDEFVFGHVGRGTYAKNHRFLFSIFKEILNEYPKSKLMLVGVGESDLNLVKHAKDLNIIDKIIFCGFQSDVSKFYSGMDALIFPSFYEGMPGTLIEAQTSGLKCYCSDSITNEVSLTENIKFISLEKSAKSWAEEILLSLREIDRKSCKEEIAGKGYSLERTVAIFEEIYTSITSE